MGNTSSNYSGCHLANVYNEEDTEIILDSLERRSENLLADEYGRIFWPLIRNWINLRLSGYYLPDVPFLCETRPNISICKHEEVAIMATLVDLCKHARRAQRRSHHADRARKIIGFHYLTSRKTRSKWVCNVIHDLKSVLPGQADVHHYWFQPKTQGLLLHSNWKEYSTECVAVLAWFNRINDFLAEYLGCQVHTQNVARLMCKPIIESYYQYLKILPTSGYGFVVYDNLFEASSIGLSLAARFLGLISIEAIHGSGFVPAYHSSIDIEAPCVLLPHSFWFEEPISPLYLHSRNSKRFMELHRSVWSRPLDERSIYPATVKPIAARPKVLFVDSGYFGDNNCAEFDKKLKIQQHIVQQALSFCSGFDTDVAMTKSFSIRPHPIYGTTDFMANMQDMYPSLFEPAKPGSLEEIACSYTHVVLLGRTTAWTDLLYCNIQIGIPAANSHEKFLCTSSKNVAYLDSPNSFLQWLSIV